MEILSIPQIATYISYVFVVVVYTIKITKIARMPVHLRWELYPVIHDKGYKYGGSYYEELEWWKKPLKANRWRSIIFKIRDYFTFPGYFKSNKSYWFGLYPWHIGFYFIVGFHILSFIGALVMITTGVSVSSGSASAAGQILYYLTIVVAVASFILGSIGSIVLLIQRLANKDLKNYASASNYVNYIFFLVVFLSGLLAWAIVDPGLSAYREFWKSLITFRYHSVEPLTFLHIMLFSVFLIYLPFTRSTHYITKIFAFFGVLWDDKPILGDKRLQVKIKKELQQTVSWSASHIQTGKCWSEVASGMPDDKKKDKNN
jgi:nitrate reductase gamma subunit